jgi:hypothetical protein
MTGVQLIGKKAVLSRFEKFDCESWALYQGKQFIVGGVGVDSLGEWLTSFDESGSTATYTLRVYDCDSAPTSSMAANDYSACMNFKLQDAYEGYGIGGHSNKLMERIGALEKQIKDREEESDDNDLNSVIMGWLNDPVKLGQVAGAIRTMIGGGGNAVQPALISGAPVQTISGFGAATEQDTETKMRRLSVALDDLGEKDPKLVEHLEKLAKLAKTDQLLFNAVISKLDAL